MKTWHVAKLAIIIVLAAPLFFLSGRESAAVTCPTSVSYGNTIDCYILSQGEVDTYTFSGVSGEQVFVRATRVTGDLYPKITIKRPDGGVKCTTYATPAAEINTCALDATGTHTLEVSDKDGTSITDIGAYGLHIQRTSNPVGSKPILFGQTAAGTGELAAEYDAYTFSGTSGDRVIVRAGRTSGSFYPKIRIFRPVGTEKCSTSGATVAESECALDATGTHTILVGDLNGDQTGGNYSVWLQRLNNPASPISISYGQTKTDTIEPVSMDAYAFSGSLNERIFVKMATDSSALQNRVRVYKPDGNLLCSTDSLTECTLNATGTFAVLVGDGSGVDTGGYGLHLQRIVAPLDEQGGQVEQLSFGYPVTSQISVVGEADAYTFVGTAGDVVFARMAGPDSSLTPQIRIYGPTGTLLCSAGFATNGDSVGNDCVLASAGTHTLIASDFRGPNTGSYGLFVQNIMTPGNTTAAAYGQTKTGNVGVVADMDTYLLTGGGSDGQLFVKVLSPSTVGPWIRTYGPGGGLLCNQGAPNLGGAVGDPYGHYLQYDCPVTSGVHTIIVGDYGGPYTGNYYAYFQRTKDPYFADGIAYGVTLGGTFAAGELKPYNFYGSSGEHIKIELDVDPDTNQTSQARLYGPDGTRACPPGEASWGDDFTKECTLSSTGIHSFFAGSWRWPYAGSFTVTLSLIPDAPPPPYDEDDPTSDPDYPDPDAGDPTSVVTGGFNHSHTDVSIPTLGVGLSFSRYYHSGSSVNRSLGIGWTHTYDMYLEFIGQDVKVHYPDGHAVTFAYSAGSYIPRPGVYDRLTQNAGIFTLTSPNQVRYVFDAGGKLIQIKDRNDNTTTLGYDGNGKLSFVTDPSGTRSLTFSYDDAGHPSYLTKVTDSLNRTVEFAYDASNRLYRVKDLKADPITGPFTTYGYDASNRMTSLTDSNGHQALQYNIYDSSGRVREQKDAVNGIFCFYYGTAPSYTSGDCPGVSPSPSASQTVVVDPRGNARTYTFDSQWRTTEVKNATSGTVRYEYDANHNSTCIEDQLGRKTSTTYDSAGNVAEAVDAANTDANCSLISGGSKWIFQYTALNDPSVVIDPLGRRTEYIYEPTHNNLTRTVRKDSGGAIKALTCFEVNGTTGRVTAVVQSTNLQLPAGPTDPCTGNKRTFAYNSAGDLTETVNPRFSGAGTPKTIVTPDAAGRMTSITDELVHKTSYTYDNQNNVREILNPLRKVVGTAGESGSQCGASGTGNGVNDDPADDSVVDDGCPSTIRTYDAKGNLLSETDANGKLTQYLYDDADRLIKVIDAGGKSTTYGYDGNGNRTSITQANRQTAGAAAESGAQCGTSGTGNGVNDDPADDSVVDDGCPSTIYGFDALDRVTTVTDALGRVTTYQYDSVGNIIAITDGNHSAIGPLETCGAGGTGDGVDDDGDTRADDGCPATLRKYDSLNRLSRIEHWNGATLADSVDYTYDAVGNRLSMLDSSSTTPTIYVYNALDRLTSVTSPAVTAPNCATPPNCTTTISYEYDNVGNRTKVTYPDPAKIVTYEYLADGSMWTVNDWLGKTTTYEYNNNGTLKKTNYPDTPGGAILMTYTYDGADRLRTILHTIPPSSNTYTYTMNAAGVRTQVQRTDHPAGVEAYQYDDLYRLTRVDYPDGSFGTYSYDGNGNRLTWQSSASGLINYSYDAADELTQVGSTLYTYDGNGNLSRRANEFYSYDHENRLKKIGFSDSVNPAQAFEPATGDPCFDLVPSSIFGNDGVDIQDITSFLAPVRRLDSSPGAAGYDPLWDIRRGQGIMSQWINIADLTALLAPVRHMGNKCPRYFDYNGDGLRVRQTIGWVATDYFWDVGSGMPVVLEETSREVLNRPEEAAVYRQRSKVTYIYGLGLIATVDDQGNEKFVFSDGLGSTTAMVRSDGTVTDQYQYDVFGKPASSSPSDTFLFTGQQYDSRARPDSGLYYLRTRYYDPTIGRFLTGDPVAAAEPYAYVSNNPTNFVDPRGLASEGPGPRPLPGPSPFPGPYPAPCPTPTPTPEPTPGPPGPWPPGPTPGPGGEPPEPPSQGELCKQACRARCAAGQCVQLCSRLRYPAACMLFCTGGGCGLLCKIFPICSDPSYDPRCDELEPPYPPCVPKVPA